jgi:hypothetical protein
MNSLYNPETDKEAVMRKMIEDAQMVESASNMTVDPSAGIDNIAKVMDEIAVGDIVPEIANSRGAVSNLEIDIPLGETHSYETINAPAMPPLQKQYVPMQDNAVQALSPTGIMELIEKARQMGQM